MEVIGPALTIISALVGAVVFVLKVNYKQSQQLLKSKKDLYQERFENLKVVTNELEKSLRQTVSELTETRQVLNVTRRELSESRQEMGRFIEATEKEIKALKTQVIQLTDNVMLITSSKGKG